MVFYIYAETFVLYLGMTVTVLSSKARAAHILSTASPPEHLNGGLSAYSWKSHVS